MDLGLVAKALVAGGKGIMATDASLGSIRKRLVEAGMIGEVGEEEARRFREVLYTAEGLGEYVGGVILRDEAIRQRADDGVSFVEHLRGQGIVVGIKVDQGLTEDKESEGEKLTEGLDGLEERLGEYWRLGARFCKWRAVFAAGGGRPTETNVRENARRMAEYARVSQVAGMAAVVEPEVLMEGEHTIEDCEEATVRVGREVFAALREKGVMMEGVVYKTNMILAGKGSGQIADDGEIAERTVRALLEVVDEQVPAVVFLSGGQGADEAAWRLNEIAKRGAGAAWRWSFSFERAFEEPVARVWQGKDENRAAAQAELIKRARMNWLASLGRLEEEKT